MGRDCPINPYKGKGKGDKGDGKGKGLWAMDNGWNGWGQPQWPSPGTQFNWPPPPPALVNQGNGGMSLGGSIDQCSVERDTDNDQWNVVCHKARGKHDMRRAKGRWGTINSLEREVKRDTINAVDQFRGNWEKVSVTVDSGAIDSVVPDTVAKGVPKRETNASRNGLKYRAANGTPIDNEGEKQLQGYTNEGSPVTMTMQVAKVTKPLGSVRAMVEANNMVVFDKGNSYIWDKASWTKTKIDERNGAFVFDIWIPKGNSDNETVNTGRYQALMEQGNQDNDNHGGSAGFVGLDDLF